MTRPEFLEALAYAADAREAAQRQLVRLANEALVAGVARHEIERTVNGAKARRLLNEARRREAIDATATETAWELAAA